MNTYLSVIVPVYNVEKFLHRCVDSILNQTFADFEIILIDDGSTDSSAQICDDFAKKNSRIKVFHQKNSGVSVARNVGVDAAKGDYITFVDSDDWLEPEMYREMVSVVDKRPEVEVVMCDFFTIKKNLKEEISAEIRKGYFSKKQIIEEIYPTLLVTEDFGRIPIVSVWNCLFKRSLLIDHKIKFDADLLYSEDYLFMANVMIEVNSFYYLKENYFYNYLQYEDSRSKKYQPDWWKFLLNLNIKLKKLLKDNKDYDFTRQLKLQLLHSVLLVLNSICNNDSISFEKKLEETKLIMNEPELKTTFSHLSFKKQSKAFKVILYLIKHKMAFNYIFLQRTISAINNA